MIYVIMKKCIKLLKDVNFSELCITSDAKIMVNDAEEVKVIATKAEGEKCSVCWKINKNGCERHPL